MSNIYPKDTFRYSRIIIAMLVSSGAFYCYLLYSADKHRETTPPGMLECQKVLDSQVESWNKGDLDGFMKGYHEDVRFFSDNTIEEGSKRLSERYHKRYKAEGKEMGKLTFTNVTVKSLSDSSAFVTGHWKVEKSNETLQGLFTLLMRKSGNDWRIVHDHTSAEPKK